MFVDAVARRVVVSLALAALAVGSAAAQAPKPLVLTLQPGPLKQTDDIDAGSGVVDVTMTIPNVQAAVGVPLFKLPRVVANVETIALTLKELVVRDGFGEVPLAGACHVSSPRVGGPMDKKNCVFHALHELWIRSGTGTSVSGSDSSVRSMDGT